MNENKYLIINLIFWDQIESKTFNIKDRNKRCCHSTATIVTLCLLAYFIVVVRQIHIIYETVLQIFKPPQ